MHGAYNVKLTGTYITAYHTHFQISVRRVICYLQHTGKKVPKTCVFWDITLEKGVLNKHWIGGSMGT